MERKEQINIILKSILLSTVITSLFSLPGRLSVIILRDTSINMGISYFIRINLLWIIIVSALIIFINVYIRRPREQSSLALSSNENVRLMTGILLSVEGVIQAANVLPMYVDNIQSMLKVLGYSKDVYKIVINKLIIVDIVSVILILIQIILGIYLIKFHDKKEK